MGKFVITEEERKHIMGLYEQTSTGDKKDEYKAKWSVLNTLYKSNPKPKYLDFMKMYKTAINTGKEIVGTEDNEVVDVYNRMVSDKRNNELVQMYDRINPNSMISSNSSKSSELGKSPITSPDDLGSIKSNSDKVKGVDTFCKSKSGYEICLMEKSMDENTAEKKHDFYKKKLNDSGYTMIEEKLRPETIDNQSVYVKSSIWKKA